MGRAMRRCDGTNLMVRMFIEVSNATGSSNRPLGGCHPRGAFFVCRRSTNAELGSSCGRPGIGACHLATLLRPSLDIRRSDASRTEAMRSRRARTKSVRTNSSQLAAPHAISCTIEMARSAPPSWSARRSSERRMLRRSARLTRRENPAAIRPVRVSPIATLNPLKARTVCIANPR
jgi:hypothetical protein